MTHSPSEGEIVECTSCGNLALGHGEIVCCDEPMSPTGEADVGVRAPSMDELIRTVFDMSETELDICLCVMEGGEQTVKELAERIEYDRSVVSRHLNHLVDLGMVEKRRRLLPDGGQIYVYTPNEPAVVRRSLAGAFLTWVGEATSLIDSLSRKKVEAIVETETDGPQWKIYQE